MLYIVAWTPVSTWTVDRSTSGPSPNPSRDAFQAERYFAPGASYASSGPHSAVLLRVWLHHS